MSSRKSKSKPAIQHDPEAQQRHLKRQLDSLERDNHESLNDVEGLISLALAQQEDDGMRISQHVDSLLMLTCLTPTL